MGWERGFAAVVEERVPSQKKAHTKTTRAHERGSGHFIPNNNDNTRALLLGLYTVSRRIGLSHETPTVSKFKTVIGSLPTKGKKYCNRELPVAIDSYHGACTMVVVS
jgi:hypothetical protein